MDKKQIRFCMFSRDDERYEREIEDRMADYEPDYEPDYEEEDSGDEE